MFLEAELVMLRDVCQPTNSFRGLCGLSEQTESSATPSVGSLFGRHYGTEALRLSPALISKDWQRCPTHFPYSKFFPYLVCQVFHSLVHVRALFAHPDSQAFCSSLFCYLWQVDLQCQSPFQSWQDSGSVQGALSTTAPTFHTLEQCWGLTVEPHSCQGCQIFVSKGHYFLQ